jgi:asparagine synthase (glutamine-hydrolysing)
MSTDDCVAGLRHYLDIATNSRLRGINGSVGTQLSAGLDSAAVTATAARLLAASGKSVVAFTAVPREGYDGPPPKNRLNDEGPLAALTAQMYTNIEHVLIRTSCRFPLNGLDLGFFLFERPILNLCNFVWVTAINEAARERKLNIMLNGLMGNATLSYSGLELLPELLRGGRLVKLCREGSSLVANTNMRWRGAFAQTFGAFVPARLWQWAHTIFTGQKFDVLTYSAIRPECLADGRLAAIARERKLDFTYRPWKDGFAMRQWVMNCADQGTYNKGILAGWGIDQRDPTADKRLVEYCLSLPTQQYLGNGMTRALAKRALTDRLPKAVLAEQRRGYQAADWHEGTTASRKEIAFELDRLAACSSAAKLLDITRLKRLVEIWPNSGWERENIIESYRLALLRGISAGHFLRKASRSNH